jgi:hypothetical protein
VHKLRCKQLRELVYAIEEAERTAGLGREGKRPIRESVVAAEMEWQHLHEGSALYARSIVWYVVDDHSPVLVSLLTSL